MSEHPTAERWSIPRQVWIVLITWGLAVVLLSGLFAFWQFRDRHMAEVRDTEQDRATCGTIGLLVNGPAPPEGPAGDRAREIIKAMRVWLDTLECDRFGVKAS